ncbi:MAG: AI-2E family transporter [Actinobacteria bacterium]|nr:AI-2E family transporter [Actinomycetota bacterium]
MRSLLVVLGVILAVGVLVELVLISRQVLTWMLIAVFFALALNPAVDWFQRRVKKRGYAVGIVYVLAFMAIALVGYVFIPPLVDQVNHLVEKIPDYIHDLTKGKGRLGFLERKYHIVEKVKHALSDGGASKLFGFSGTAISITKSVVTIVIAAVTITFMTFFMLLEGHAWVNRFYSMVPEKSRPRWQAVGRDIYRTIGGYVLGNILISLIAGGSAAIVLFALGVPLAAALGLLVGLFDLIPLAGATIALLVVGTIAFLHSITAGIVVVIFFIVYQQLENHILQPVIYGKTVKLSPLAVLIAVLIGAALAGVIGALAAIPIAGAIQVVILDVLRARAERKRLQGPPADAIPGEASP